MPTVKRPVTLARRATSSAESLKCGCVTAGIQMTASYCGTHGG